MKKLLYKFSPFLIIALFILNNVVCAEEIKVQEAKTATNEQKIDENVSILISGIGDCTLGSDIRSSPVNSFMSTFEKNNRDYEYFFKNVKPILEKDDMTIANLEGPLTSAVIGMEKQFQFKGLPEFTSIIKHGSIEAVNLANNHSHDFFEAGYKDTVTALKKANISYFGYGNKTVKTIKGVKIGILGYKVWSNNKDIKTAIKKDIKAMRTSGVKIVIVNFHWGDERKNYPIPLQETFGRYTIDCGADLILGHHSHVIQSIEKYKNKYIVYSLGNFCMGGNRNPTDKDSFIFQQSFNFKNGKQVKGSINIIPCSVSSVKERNNYQPMPLVDKDKDRVIYRINEYSKKYNFKFVSNRNGNS